VEQMRRLPGVLEARRAVARRFTEELSSLPGLTLPIEPPGHRHVYQSYVTMVVASGEDRDRVALALQEAGIATRQGTHAVHALGYYRRKYDLSPGDFPNAWRADRQSLTLPLYAGMPEEEQAYVVAQVRKQLG
jgi:perosamine synthetase